MANMIFFDDDGFVIDQIRCVVMLTTDFMKNLGPELWIEMCYKQNQALHVVFR